MRTCERRIGEKETVMLPADATGKLSSTLIGCFYYYEKKRPAHRRGFRTPSIAGNPEGSMAKRRRTRNSAPRRRQRTRVATIRMRSRGRVVTADIGRHAELTRVAQKWSYILGSRARWKDDERVRESYRADALADLVTLGVPQSYLRSMAGCAHV